MPLTQLPSFDDKGNISMHEVISARPEDFTQFGVDVVAQLKMIRDTLENFPCDAQDYSYGGGKYSEAKSDFIHSLLNDQEVQKRTPHYQHKPLYCFYYNIYCFLFNSAMYYRMSDDEIKAFDLEILDCEIERVEDPSTFLGRANPTVISSYVGKTITIQKGVRITRPGLKEYISKRATKVIVHHVNQGYYYLGVHHPAFLWAGSGGYWQKVLCKDVFK